jgi:O-antigen ligase
VTGPARALRTAAGTFAFVGFAVPFVAFGGRGLAWAVAASAGAVGVAGLLLLVAAWCDPARRGARVPWPLAAPALALLALGLAATVRLPAGVASWLSPRRAAVLSAVPADIGSWPRAAEPRRISVREATAADGERPAPLASSGIPAASLALSWDVVRSRRALVVLACFLGFVLAAACERDPAWLQRVLGGVVALAAAGAAYGIWAHHANLPFGTIHGVLPMPPGTSHRPYATFWNLNHAAALFALLCPVAAAAVLGPAVRWWLSGLACLAAVPLALAVLDAGSRGGLLAAGLAALLLGLMLLRRRGTRLVGAALAAAAVLGTVLAFTVLAPRLIDETLESTTELRGSNLERAHIYANERRMLRGAPLVGVGLGAFVTAYPAWNDRAEATAPLHGESDWLESLAEGGVPLFVAWVALASGLLWPPLLLAARGAASVLTCGLLAGSLATLAHAAVDFHHREPSVALASILLAATAHVRARVEDEGARAAAGGLRLAVLAAVLGAALLLLAIAARTWVPADVALRAGDAAAQRADGAAVIEAARRLVRASPQDADGWALLALGHETVARGRGADRRQHLRRALQACVEALRRNPAAPGAARRAGSILLALDADDAARRAADLAALVSPGSPRTQALLGQVCLAEGRPDEALRHLGLAFAGTPPGALAAESRLLARLLLRAAGGDTERAMSVVHGGHHERWFLQALSNLGLDQDVRVGYTVVARAPDLERADVLAGTLGLVSGPEAAALARVLLPHVRSPWATLLAGRALLDGGAPEEGTAVLRRAITAPDAHPDAFVVLAMTLRQAGRIEEAAEVVALGRRRYPELAAFAPR